MKQGELASDDLIFAQEIQSSNFEKISIEKEADL